MIVRVGKAPIAGAVLYLAVWLGIVIWWWVSIGSSSEAGSSGSWLLGYIVTAFYVLLPAASFAASLLVGWRCELGARRVMTVLASALGYVLALVATFGLANALGRANIADDYLFGFIMGVAPALLGLATGAVARRVRDRARGR